MFWLSTLHWPLRQGTRTLYIDYLLRNLHKYTYTRVYTYIQAINSGLVTDTSLFLPCLKRWSLLSVRDKGQGNLMFRVRFPLVVFNLITYLNLQSYSNRRWLITDLLNVMTDNRSPKPVCIVLRFTFGFRERNRLKERMTREYHWWLDKTPK